MALVKGKFIVKEVSDMITAKSGNQYKMVVLEKPGYTDEFGEKKGTDEHMRVTVYNDQFNAFGQLTEGDKISAEVNVRFREYIHPQGNGTPSYIYNASFYKAEKL